MVHGTTEATAVTTSEAPVRVVLAHGASGTAASMAAHVAGLEQRGIPAQAIDLPRGRAERAVPPYLAAAPPDPRVVIGGQSFGGRVASMCAAEHPYAGLVLLSYPLHAPGAAEWEGRVEHWPNIECPVLLLSGAADPFARLDWLREAVKRLPKAELVTYPRLRHTLKPVLDDALDRVAQFVQELP